MISSALKARRGGWTVHGDGREEVWTRGGEQWGVWWRRLTGKPKENELLEVDRGIAEKSWLFWMKPFRWYRKRTDTGETRPLLSS